MRHTYTRFGEDNRLGRREEIIGRIERALTRLSDGELEALYYDMLTKDYIHETNE